jgi:hypothetical protein
VLKALASQHLLHALPRATRLGLGLGSGQPHRKLARASTPTPNPQPPTPNPQPPTPNPQPPTPSSEARLSAARNSLVSNRRLRDVGAAMGVAPLLLLPDKASKYST